MTNTKNISVLKEKLKDLLIEETVDNDLLLSLSHELVSLEQNKVRFSNTKYKLI